MVAAVAGPVLSEGLGRTAHRASAGYAKCSADEAQSCDIDWMPCLWRLVRELVPVELEEMASTIRCEVLPGIGKRRGSLDFTEVPYLTARTGLPGAEISDGYCLGDA